MISATNFPAQLDRAFLSRITNFIKMPLPDDSTRKLLFIKYLQDSELSHNMRPEHLSQVAKETERFSFRDCQRQGLIFFKFQLLPVGLKSILKQLTLFFASYYKHLTVRILNNFRHNFLYSQILYKQCS